MGAGRFFPEGMRLLKRIEGGLNTLFLFALEDGSCVEAVFYRGDTLCVSTQVGCPIRCGFCASGSRGFVRNLSAEEIIAQYALLKEELPVKGIAFAGIGEPLANWRSVLDAFWFFKGEGLRVSFYTSGFPLDRLAKLIDLPHRGLTLSLHSLDDSVRLELMPGSGSASALINFLRAKLPSLSRKKLSRISVGYLLIRGVNDNVRNALRLAKLAKELGLSVTLLRVNEFGGFYPSSEESYEEFFKIIRFEGVKVTLSTRFRRDKIGGCGTLVINREHTFTEDRI